MEEQIRRFGCGDPISVWSGRLLVDYERYAIFHCLHIPFRIINNSARNSEEVIEWICRNQLQRTDLTGAIRRYLIGRQFLALKLLGAHYAASTPPSAGKCRIPPIGLPKYGGADRFCSNESGSILIIRAGQYILGGATPPRGQEGVTRQGMHLQYFRYAYRIQKNNRQNAGRFTVRHFGPMPRHTGIALS